MTKFFLPESDDRVDPGYDFLCDAYAAERAIGLEHDVYAHNLFGVPQCDGLLVTRSNIKDQRKRQILDSGGIHAFLKVDASVPVIADCGAFQYLAAEFPPYDSIETLGFYEELGFDYGITLDHLILEFDQEYDRGGALLAKTVTDEMRRRFKLTIRNAKTMLSAHRKGRYSVELIGAVQGWSPKSYARGVAELINHGFDYIALGGLARASDTQIRSVLEEVGPIALKAGVGMHLLGVARLSLLPDFKAANVVSCDSASAILQAFKSNKDNYHTSAEKYTAVRIPPASGDLSPKVRKLLKLEESRGGKAEADRLHRRLIRLEQRALKAIREYGAGEMSLGNAMKALIAYEDEFDDEKRYYPLFEKTLRDQPWKKCPCAICRKIGIEVILLRGNNRNRRRGFHNTYVFYEQFRKRREALQACS